MEYLTSAPETSTDLSDLYEKYLTFMRAAYAAAGGEKAEDRTLEQFTEFWNGLSEANQARWRENYEIGYDAMFQRDRQSVRDAIDALNMPTSSEE